MIFSLEIRNISNLLNNFASLVLQLKKNKTKQLWSNKISNDGASLYPVEVELEAFEAPKLNKEDADDLVIPKDPTVVATTGDAVGELMSTTSRLPPRLDASPPLVPERDAVKLKYYRVIEKTIKCLK